MRAIKYFMYMILAVLLVQIATAANTGYVVDFDDGNEPIKGCVYVPDGSSAMNVIKAIYEFKSKQIWANNILTSLNGTANTNTTAWYLWSNEGGSSFVPKGTAYTTVKVYDNYVIGLGYSTSNSTGAPSYDSLYDDLCPNKLNIRRFLVKVDGTTARSVDEYGGTIKVKPNSTVSINIQLENLWDPKEKADGRDDIMINNVLVEAFIEDIDNGYDLEAYEEADEIDIEAKGREDVEVIFQIPFEVEKDRFKLPVTITSEDDVKRRYIYEIELEVSVEKERNQLVFRKAELVKENVSCIRSNSVNYRIQNIGTRDEKSVVLTLVNTALGISTSSEFELISDPFDSDSERSGAIPFNVPEDAKAGTYVLTLTAEYNKGSSSLVQELALKVENCIEDVEEEDAEDSSKDNTTTTTTGKNQDVQIVRPIVSPAQAETEEKSFLKDNGMIIGIVIAEIIVIGAIVALVLALRKRKY